MFSGILIAKVPEIITMPFAKLNGIFTEFVRKLSHTRVQEFLDIPISNLKKGAATSKEVNLRDTLLGHHVNLKNKHQRISLITACIHSVCKCCYHFLVYCILLPDNQTIFASIFYVGFPILLFF